MSIILDLYCGGNGTYSYYQMVQLILEHSRPSYILCQFDETLKAHITDIMNDSNVRKELNFGPILGVVVISLTMLVRRFGNELQDFVLIDFSAEFF